MKKKLAAALICLSMAAASLTACGGDTTSTPAATQEAAKTETPAAGGEAASGDVKEITEAIDLEGADVIVTGGRGMGDAEGFKLVEELAALLGGVGGHAGCEAALASARMGFKTIIFAISLDSIAMMPCNPSIGGSSKGLGAAGVDENQELDRVKSVIAKAEEQGMTIIALHIGGSARRGTLSDKFIPDALAAADAAIIVSEGDSDGFMKGIVTENGVATAFIDNQVGAVEPLKTIFGK